MDRKGGHWQMGSVGPAPTLPPKKCIVFSNPRAELLRRGALSHKELITVALRQGSILHAAHTIQYP